MNFIKPQIIFFLLPLTWAIMMYFITYGINSALGLTAISIVSFILTAITTVTLSSFKVLDSGLGEGANKMLFILIFGGIFYGVAVASLYLGGNAFGSGSFANGVLTYPAFTFTAFDNIPTYVKQIYFADIHLTVDNPNYNANSPLPNGTELGGLGFQANSGMGNPMFIDMPYFTAINVILALIYVFGLYLMVSES